MGGKILGYNNHRALLFPKEMGKKRINPKRGEENLGTGVGYAKGRYYHPKHLRYSAGTSSKKMYILAMKNVV